VRNDPVNSVDPTGEKSTVTQRGIEIDPLVQGVPSVRIPHVRGAQGFGDFERRTHSYPFVNDNVRSVDAQTAGDAIANKPTPGPNNSPASSSGVRNDAGPLLPPFDGGDNYVMSFRVESPDPTKFTDITVNYTINSEHIASEGFVLRYGALDQNGNLAAIVTYGEGTAAIQDEVFSPLTDPFTESVWDRLSQRQGLAR
jgi:hypothetical protein